MDKRDKYLRAKYGVSLDWYNQRLAEQDGGCWICGSKPVTRSLPVDHDHKYKRVKVLCTKFPDGGWYACADMPRHYMAEGSGDTKSQAVQSVRKDLKRLSVRGVICVGCNIGIRKFRDSPEFLEKAALYLRKHKGETQ